jgi:hypothetical protein
MKMINEYVPTEVEKQRRIRILLSLYAYAYEFKARSIVSDADYDHLALQVDTLISTGNKKLDTFFKREYNPYTGQWIHKHPEKNKLEALYTQYDLGFPNWLYRIGANLYDMRGIK